MIPQEEMEVEPPQGELLERIVKLATRQVEIEEELEALAERIKGLNAEHEGISGGFRSEGLLVTALQEAGMASFTLTNGTVVQVNDVVQVPSVAAKSKYREPVLNWLDGSGNGDVIKREIGVQFAKDETEKAENLRKLLADAGFVFNETRQVNPQTLGALIRELLERGEELPMTDLGIAVLKKTAVEIPGKKKKK